MEDMTDYEFDASDFIQSDHEIHNPDEEQKVSMHQMLDNLADGASKVFIRQRPIRYIDIHEDYVSKEESEYRLLVIFFIFTFTFGIVASSLLIVCPFKCTNTKVIILEHKIETALGIASLMFQEALAIIKSFFFQVNQEYHIC